MGNNKYTAQLRGSFKAGQELYSQMQEAATGIIQNVVHLGVQVEPGTMIVINNKEIEIGQTGIYEIYNTKITSLYFKNDVSNVLIDYVVKI